MCILVHGKSVASRQLHLIDVIVEKLQRFGAPDSGLLICRHIARRCRHCLEMSTLRLISERKTRLNHGGFKERAPKPMTIDGNQEKDRRKSSLLRIMNVTFSTQS